MFRMEDLNTREFAADGPVEVGGGIVGVDHIDLFSACEPRNLPEEPPIQAGSFAKSDDARCLVAPGARFFQTTNNEAKFLGGILDKIQDNTFQSAHAQTEYDLHDGFRGLHEGHTLFDKFHFAHGK